MELRPDAVVLVLDPDLGAEPGDDLGGVLGRRGEHELERMEEGELGGGQRVVASESGEPADVADQHPGPLHVVERPVERTGDRGLDETLAKADPEVAAEHLDDVLRGQRIGPGEEIVEDARLAGWAGGLLDLGERGGHLGECRRELGRRRVTGLAEHLGHGDTEVGRAVVRLAERGPWDADEAVMVVAIADQPSPAARWSASANGRPVRNTAAIGQLLGRQGPQVIGEDGRLLGGPGRRRETLGELAPATHWTMVYRARDGAENVVPGVDRGPSGHPAAARSRRTSAAFRRWYADPEIARLARYQATPMRAEEIERFFAARVVGPDALAMAVHVRATDRLIGTCAFSQLDGENGSALYHITIGEPDTWGNGYGTEATQLMVDHAFGTLGLHRVSLYVFEFNERAIQRLSAVRASSSRAGRANRSGATADGGTSWR